MSPTPEVQPLPYQHRQFVFVISLVIFCVTVPLLVFYAIGYRFDFSGDDQNIKSVGGMYVTADVRDLQIFVDDMPVQDMRVFQNAAYIQNLQSGMHQIHTQGEGVQTWVKELPVFPHFVTEIQSFNMPEVPQIRFITPYTTQSGLPVLHGTSSILTFASSTTEVYATSSTATSTFVYNPKFTFIEKLFASSSEAITVQQKKKKQFIFQDQIATSTEAIVATTTKTYRSTRLYQDGQEVYIKWEGNDKTIPYYYCVRYDATSTIAALYGHHVSDDMLATSLAAESQFVTDTELTDGRHCRDTIRIDRKGMEVHWFDYMPGSRDLVLMHLDDGLYVVEVDDRTWQNVQLLYPGEALEVLVDGSSIVVKDGEMYLEVFTELQ